MNFLQDLTPRGRTVAAMGLGALVFGRVLALRELYMVASAMIGLTIIAIVLVTWRRGTLGVKRAVTPERTTAGNEIRVELNLVNRGRSEASQLLLEDQLPPSLNVSARLALPSLDSGAERKVAYVVKARTRGRYVIGPLDVARTDPFGLAMRRLQLAGESNAIVYPAYEALTSMPQFLRRQGAVRRSPTIGEGDEFYALRPYAQGDDLRRVHWPTSLRRGELLVRQLEVIREPSVLVVIDTCASKHRGTGAAASIEAAVSACAAICMLALDSRMPLLVWSAEGRLTANSRPGADELLEALAVLPASGRPSMHEALAEAMRSGAGSASVFCITPGLAAGELAGVRELAGRAAGGAVVLIDAPTFQAGQHRATSDDALGVLGLPVIRLSSGDNFRSLWESYARRVTFGMSR